MKFNLEETQILLQILKHKLESPNLIEINKETTYLNLIEKLENGEYIKGRLLNFLQIEITNSDFNVNSLNKIIVETILKKVKFKATPR
ncbi:hypothetical protein [Flavobacterium sp. I3-2]|uniref:hypothetical protein n=1 Tax=Flavobacterium sp. I3-2 TaxID=2748319 RepID=UPI0015A8FD2C|nr:hypothetical protein [Flavobacterium sp. I3-2]